MRKIFVSKSVSSALHGGCQSCVAKLDLRQCVSHSEAHRPTTYYVNADNYPSPSSQSTITEFLAEVPELGMDEENEESVSNDLRLQSDEATVVLEGSEPSQTTSTTVVEFLDETPGSSWGLESPNCTNLMDRQPEVELAKFLSRPVLIKSHVWAQTDSYTTTTTWDPWYLFFNSTPIKNKLNNYSFINCTLKLKFVINASPFYSGAMAFTYNPLAGLNGNSIIADPGGGELIPYSQRAKVWIFPQTCEGGELHLPFFYHKNWLNITSATDTRNMGTITPALYAPLVSANGATGTSVVVNVYAWAEDVKLHAPTTKLALQSDEFDYKPSQIASAVAKSTSALSRIPMIGPYMKATSSVATGLAKVASSLGFTNVPNIDKVDFVKLQPFPHNSTCEISVPSDRASVDPKNEVTIDPRTVGLDGTDELNIAYIAGRESYIGSAILSSTDAVDQLTLVSRVAPSLVYQNTSNKPWQMTPMAYTAAPFGAWRGDIIFRFKFICTRFHKGRVRVTFDPTNDISTTVPDYTTVFNEVVDIGAQQDLEVRVPYSQATTFLPLNVATGNYNLSGSSLVPDQYSNGLITMRVVNPLSGPLATTAIPVLVFVRAAENIEFAYPTPISSSRTVTASPYTLQSREVEYAVDPAQVTVGNKPTTPDPNRYLVHYGEKITSFRPLIHRFAHMYSNDTFGVATANTLTILTHTTSRRLKYQGYDPNGYWSAAKTLAAGNAPYNYVRMNVHQWVSLLFVGQRGSVNHMFNIEHYNVQAPNRVTLSRRTGTIASSDWTNQLTSNTASVNVASQLYQTHLSEEQNGVALTDFTGNPSIVMNFPYYSRYNFQFVNPANATLGSTIDDTDTDNIQLQMCFYKVATAASLRVHAHSAYGHDYNFFYFNNTPSIYYYNTPTGA